MFQQHLKLSVLNFDVFKLSPFVLSLLKFMILQAGPQSASKSASPFGDDQAKKVLQKVTVECILIVTVNLR